MLEPKLKSLFLYRDKFVLDTIGLQEEESIIEVPQYLREFVEKHIKKWVASAFCAMYQYKEDQSYVIKDSWNGQKYVEIVDCENTGVLQESMVLNNGLHQFLQLKHDLVLQSESLVCCQISNVEFFKGYGKNLVGLSGTLGSEKERATLETIYGIETSYIPTFKTKCLIEYPFLLKRDKSTWSTSIIESAYSEYKSGRVVLIINRHIQTAEYLKDKLSHSHQDATSDIILYQRNDKKQTISDDIIGVPKIIISTNLAGRGTDIEISDEINRCGGLHVILTYMPKNVRVQNQAFGRAARKGQKGTCQLISNEEDLQNRYGKAITGDYFKVRDYSEEETQKDLKIDYEIVTRVKDEIFSKFCEFINRPEYKNDLRQKSSIEEKFSLFIYNVNERLQEKSNFNSHQLFYLGKEQKKIQKEKRDLPILESFSNDRSSNSQNIQYISQNKEMRTEK